ncbi:pyridoxamine 5'-phosphate oxidase family protein [Microlunatus lacustris]
MTVPFDELAEDFLAFTADIVYCTVTTVDGAGRPRSRVMHPVFEVVDGRPRGWAVTDRSPVKTRHLAANPYVCCSYWSPAHNTVTVDCEARWVEDDETLQYVWDLFRDTPPPLGWGDLAAYEPERIAHPLFHPLRLTPWRVQVLRAEQLAAGDFSPRTWRATPSTGGASPRSTG